MTDKELRALKRADLIEILYYLRRENDDLRAENAKLNARMDAILAGTLRVNPPPDSAAPPVADSAEDAAGTAKSPKKR